jgi:hypothetical protein
MQVNHVKGSIIQEAIHHPDYGVDAQAYQNDGNPGIVASMLDDVLLKS